MIPWKLIETWETYKLITTYEIFPYFNNQMYLGTENTEIQQYYNPKTLGTTLTFIFLHYSWASIFRKTVQTHCEISVMSFNSQY
jgi:hypothetical protein